MKFDVWIIHKTKKILVTDLPGPPVDVCFVSANAKDKNNPTISEIFFDKDDLMQFDDWQAAIATGDAKSKELGYVCEISSNRWY